jgi:hypothetical protein
LQHLDYGAAGAKVMTLSWWFEVSKRRDALRSQPIKEDGQPFLRSRGNGRVGRHMGVISAVTFPGDTGGTINNDTGAGLYDDYISSECSGRIITTLAGRMGVWDGEYDATSNQQNLLDNTANNFYITQAFNSKSAALPRTLSMRRLPRLRESAGGICVGRHAR